MPPLACFRLVLLVLLAIVVAGGSAGVRAGTDQPFYDQTQAPSPDGLISDDGPFNLDDDPPGVAELFFAFGPHGCDARLRPIAGRDRLSCFLRFLIPFETGPPAA